MATNFFVCMYVYIHRFVHCSISIYYISPIFRSVHTTAFLYVVDFGKHINHYFWLVALRYKGIILLSCLTRSLITHFLHSRYSIVFCNEMLLSMLYMFWPIKSLYLIHRNIKMRDTLYFAASFKSFRIYIWFFNNILFFKNGFLVQLVRDSFVIKKDEWIIKTLLVRKIREKTFN